MFPQQVFMTPYQLFFKCLEIALVEADHEYDENRAHDIFYKLASPGVFQGNERTVAQAATASQDDSTQPTIVGLVDSIIRYEYENDVRPNLYNALGLTRERG